MLLLISANICRPVGRLRFAIVIPDSPRQNVRDRSCCGLQQDRHPNRTRGPSCPKRSSGQQVPHEVHLGRKSAQPRAVRGTAKPWRDAVVTGWLHRDQRFQRSGKEFPAAGEFYDHTEGEFIWRQDLVYSFYPDDKASYLLTFCQYKKADDEDQDDETNVDGELSVDSGVSSLW